MYVVAEELVMLHTRPNLWWNGQLVAYITRLNTTVESEFKEIMEERLKIAANVG